VHSRLARAGWLCAWLGAITVSIASATYPPQSPATESDSNTEAASAYEQGMKLLRAGQYSQALEQFRRTEDLAPKLPNGATGEGIALALMGKPDEAVAALQRALALDPQYWVARRELGIVYWEQHLGDQAAEQLRPILRLFPDDAAANAIVGQYEFQQKHYQEALALFAKLPNLDAQPPIALMHAEALLSTGKETEAAEALKRLMGRPDLTANQDFLLGWLLGRARLYAEAIEVLKLTPKNSPNLFSHQYGLALAYFLAGKTQDAIVVLSELAQGGEKRPDLFALLGTAYEKNGNLLEAYNAFRQGILNNPDDSVNYLDIASLAAQHRNYDLAAELLTQGVQRIHDDYRLYLSRGLVFSLERKLVEAHSDYLKASALAPQEPQVALALGLNYVDLDQVDEAVAIFQHTAELHMQDSRPYYFLEQALLRKGVRPGSPEFTRAADAIASALAIDPNFVWGLVERSRLTAMQGKNQEALADLQRAQQLEPASGIIKYRLAQTYQKLGDEAKAKELFAAAEKSIHEEAERVQQKNMLTIMATTTSRAGQSFDDRLGGSQ